MGPMASPRTESISISTMEHNAKRGNIGPMGDSDLERLIRLFNHADTADLTERQLVVLGRLCKLRQKGFRYSELGLVEALLPLVESRVVRGQNSIFREPFSKLLNICSLAPVCDRANEAFTERGLSAKVCLLRALGRTLWSFDGDIQAVTADVLMKIAAGNDPTRSKIPVDDGNPNTIDCCWLHDLRPKPRDINQALLLGCGVVATAVSCLDTVMTSMLETSASMDQVSLQSSGFSDSDDIERAENESCTTGDIHLKPEPYKEIDQQSIGDVVTSGIESRTSGGRKKERPEIEDSFTRTVADTTTKHKVLISLLELVRELSTDATSSAAMVEVGLVSLLVQIMRAARGVRDPTLFITVEVMWNCLEHSQKAMIRGPPAESRSCLIRKARKSNAAFALSTWDGVLALREAVETLLITGFKIKDKELRNEALVVASLLAGRCRSHPLFRKTGFLLLLLRYATAVETGLADGYPGAEDSEKRTIALARDEDRGGDDFRDVPELGALADPRNFATVTEVDMELKLLLWPLLTDICKRDPRNLEVVEASPLIETLLMYADLVVEEGPSLDAPVPGINRSVSLASIPRVGTCQTASVILGASAAATARSEDDAGRRGEETGIEWERPAPTAAIDTRIPGSQIERSSEQPHRIDSSVEILTSSARLSRDSSRFLGKEASSAGGKRGQVEPFLGVTQLYVPATIMRLPVTSIKLLQGQAIASLSLLAARCSTKFQALGGHMVILRLLDRLGSRPENQSLVKKVTRMLATVVGFPGIKEEFGRVDGVRIMLDRFSDASRREPRGSGGSGCVGELDGHNSGEINKGGGYDTRTDIVVILCRLCDQCLENQEAFRKENGVSIMMNAIKAYCWSRRNNTQLGGTISEGAREGVGNWKDSGGALLSTCTTGIGSENSADESLDPALVHIVDCVWCAVVGNRRSEARLLQCEGLDTLLDLLELCPSSMRHQVTGIVADILHNKHALPVAKAWRSDVNILSITQLMMRFWVAEEARLGVSRPDGVLQNLWQPLHSHERGTGCRIKHTGPLTRASSGRSRNAAIRDCTKLTSGVNAASDDQFLQTSPDDMEEVTSRSPEDRVEIPANSTLAGESGAGKEVCGRLEVSKNQEVINGEYPAIALALQVCKRVATTGQKYAIGRSKRASTTDAHVSKVTRGLDLRSKIAAVLEMVGFDDSVKDVLGPKDLKAFYMARSYLGFRKGEAWQEVAGTLEAKNINPIAADALVLDTMLEEAFNRAQEVKSKQMAVTVKQAERDRETEQAFFASILFQRDQEIRQAVIKRNALLPGMLKRVKTQKMKHCGTSAETCSAEVCEGSKQDDVVIEPNKRANVIKAAA